MYVTGIVPKVCCFFIYFIDIANNMYAIMK
jgi:hypothetical protein